MKPLLAAFTLALVSLAPVSVAIAQPKPPIPDLINQGLNAYAQNGLNNALQTWLHHSLLDRNTLLRTELAALKFADANYGLFEKGEVMRVAEITPRVTRVYLVLYYERAPLWAWFDLYRTRAGNEVISDVYFSPKVQVILPADLVER